MNENAYKNKKYGINDEIHKRKTPKERYILNNANHHTKIDNDRVCLPDLKSFENDLKCDWKKKPNKKDDD